MERVHDTVSWYQQKIGSYDKQLWEQSVDQKVLKGIQQAPRRVVRPKTGLIDVDLIRGSTFTKTKPQVPWTYVTLKTFSRVVLFPFHYRWWIQQTSFLFWLFLMMLYVMQLFTIIVFFNNVGDNITQDEQGLGEVMIPFVLMLGLGLIHSQTILTHLKPPVRDNKRDGWRRKRSLSQTQNRSASDIHSSATSETLVPGKTSSNTKGHLGSRPLRERAKERKSRSKGGNARTGVHRELLNAAASQDSESAYHTHEASDSIADRTSSVEAESTNRESKGDDSSLSKKLDISPRVPSLVSPLHTCDKKNGSVVLKKMIGKTQESQESDLPEDSNSEDESLLKPGSKDVTGSKRNSQSISSDNDLEDCKPVAEILEKDTGRPVSKILEKDTGRVELLDTETKLDTSETKMKEEKEPDLDVKVNFEGQSHCGVNADTVKPRNGVVMGKITDKTVQSKQLTKTDKKPAADESDSCIPGVTPPSVILPPAKSHCSVMKRSPIASASANKIPANSVHFTKDLVKLREITPLSSRETTPTHSQGQKSSSVSDVQNKVLRTGGVLNNLDSDTDSENEVTVSKSLPSVRRRKVTVQDCEEVGAGSTLRQRRRASGRPDHSSSENETEGHSSEYSRASRQNVASSEEWGDHLQTEVDTSSESSSCGSEPRISGNEEPDPPTDTEQASSTLCTAGLTSSHMHVINLLQPSSSQSSANTDKVTCIIWERNECKKVELTAMDIGWAIIETVDKIPESSDYILIGFTFSFLMGLTPLFFQAFHMKELPAVLSVDCALVLWETALASTWRQNLIHANAVIQRLFLSALFFFLLSVADRTFKQRLLYAKHFCYLTSSRRARKFDLPHFRLNKVRNIKTWLSLRSYLKKRGPQRSVDVIVSFAFLITLMMLILMCLQLLRDAEIYLNYLCNWEILVWCMALGVYLLRFMTLGLRINKKYRNLSVLITEQINLYLQMEQKPHKKEELMVANNVLKLAESLLKELESPFKISGISANPLVLNVTRVVVLSAFSAVLTELLGFKLKLYKIKLRA